MKNFVICLSLCVTLFPVTTLAIDLLANGRLSLRGFGTVGVSCYSSDTLDFLREERPDGPGKNRRCDHQIDSNVGLQVDANLTDSVQITGQATSYHRADDTYTPELTLANLRWVINDKLNLRLGRMQLPIYFSSEYRNVLYAQTWVRPPTEVYNLATAYSIDGLELNYNQMLSDWELRVSTGVAESRFDTTWSDAPHNTYEAKVHLGYLDLRLSKQSWQFKASLLGGKLSWHQPQVDYLLSLLNPQLASDLMMIDKRLIIASGGVRYENNDWLIQTEYLYRTIDSFYRDQHGIYLLMGHRFGKWMPYSIFSKRWSESQGKENHATLLDAALAQAIVNGTYDDHNSVALGLSRQLGEKAIIKYQANIVMPDSGFLQSTTIDTLHTLNLDFVF